jgi:hypothetical protein
MTPRLHPLLYSPQSIHGALIAQLLLLLAGSNANSSPDLILFVSLQGFVVRPETLARSSNLMVWNCINPGKQGVIDRSVRFDPVRFAG